MTARNYPAIAGRLGYLTAALAKSVEKQQGGPDAWQRILIDMAWQTIEESGLNDTVRAAGVKQ